MSSPVSAGRTVALAADNQAYLAGAGHDGAPGIVVIQEAFGVNAFVKATCDRFAARGYQRDRSGLLPRPHVRLRRPRQCDRCAQQHRRRHRDERNRGGRRRTHCPRRAPRCDRRRRVLHGRAARVPRERDARSALGGDRVVLRRRHCAARAEGQAQAAARSRADDITAPALLIYGAKDASIGPDEHARLARALTEANKRYTIAVFPDAPHAFATFDRESYREQAATQAWRTADDFLAAIFGR